MVDILDDPNDTLSKALRHYQTYCSTAYGSEEEKAAAIECAIHFGYLHHHLKAGGALPVDWDVSPGEPDYRVRARELVGQGLKIRAIKEVRTATGWSLTEAKDYVDSL